MAPILTIAIPTYNRPIQIQNQVRLLLPQINEQVELVVYDNCSDINIKSYFTQDELSKFSLVRNIVNVGGDANIARCFENCRTKWLWTLSDDDFVHENAVQQVFETISVRQDYLWINFDTDITAELTGFAEFMKNNNRINQLSDLLWISKSIHNMDKIRPYIYYQYKYVSSMYSQTIPIIKYLEHHKDETVKMYRCQNSIFSFKDTNTAWNFHDYLRMTSIMFNVFEEQNIDLAKKTFLKTLTRIHFEMISTLNSKKEMRFFIRKSHLNYGLMNTYRYLFKINLTTTFKAYMPDFIIKFARTIKKMIK